MLQDKPNKYWLEDLGLYEADEKCLKDGRWLTDNVIDAAQALLKKAHPYVGGLESVALGETLAFSVQRGEFVQVLNTAGSHWITVSNIGCKPGTVSIYDSLPNVNIPSRTKEQIASLLCAQENTITLQLQHVQQQHGSADCGLFAIAFAVSLCCGQNPEQTHFIQHQFRKHLQQCLVDREISSFPQTKRRRRQVKFQRVENFCIYCICRLPEEGKMIECNSCYEWFHEHCVNVSSFVWKRPESSWFCTACSQRK